MQLDDLGVRERAGRLGREAHHQHGAEREVRRHEARNTYARGASWSSSASPASSRPVVPITHGTPAASARIALPSTAAGAVKSTAASKPLDVDRLADLDSVDLVARRARAPHQDRADLAVAAEEQDPHAAATATSGLMARTAARKRFSLGPIPAAERRSGAKSSRASSATSSAVTAAIRSLDLLDRDDLGFRHGRLARAGSSGPRSTRATAACVPSCSPSPARARRRGGCPRRRPRARRRSRRGTRGGSPRACRRRSRSGRHPRTATRRCRRSRPCPRFSRISWNRRDDAEPPRIASSSAAA